MAKFRAGDFVRAHMPQGAEDWIVAVADDDRLAWLGWPEGYIHLSEVKVEMLKAATDDEHLETLEQVSRMRRDDGSEDLRTRWAKRELDAMPRAFVGGGI